MDRLTKVHTGFGKLNFDSIIRSGSSSARSPSNSPSPNVGNPSLSNGHTIASPISMSRTASPRRVDTGDQSSLGNITMGGSGAGDQVGSFRDASTNPSADLASRRRSAIAFDPQVKADGGVHFPLQAPLPRPIRTDLTKEGYFENRQLPTRSFTWSEQDAMRSSRGEVDGNGVGNGSGRIYERGAIGQFLSPTSYGSPEPERVASLTSDFTMSPVSDEFHTPPPRPDAFGEFCTSPFVGSPLTDRLQQGGSPMWPSRSLTHSGRNKSYTFENRSRSRSSRSQSGRSASPRYGGSTQLSPANMFLNNFNNCKPQSVEPDSEGQEVGSYVLGKQIGFGGFSVVKEAITIEGGVEIKRAVKIVRKKARDADFENDKIQADFDHEVSLWRCISHPNILPLIAVYDTPFATFAFTKLIKGGSLYDLIKTNRDGVSARMAQRYCFQLACALRYLHEDMRIMHKDVKLENCLVDMSVDTDGGGNLLLCDFGMAEFIKSHDEEEEEEEGKAKVKGGNDDDDSSNDGIYFSSNRRRSRKSSTASTNSAFLPSTTTSLRGSLEYASPEMVSCPDTSPSVPHFTTAVDVWAFGVVAYVLHTGSLPFSHSFQPKLMSKIMIGEYDEEKLRTCRGLMEAGGDAANDVAEVIRGCLATRIDQRWDIRRVLESSWLRQFGDEAP